jgi:hypothetical protein
MCDALCICNSLIYQCQTSTQHSRSGGSHGTKGDRPLPTGGHRPFNWLEFRGHIIALLEGEFPNNENLTFFFNGYFHPLKGGYPSCGQSASETRVIEPPVNRPFFRISPVQRAFVGLTRLHSDSGHSRVSTL